MGTGIDPEDVLEPYGADATRYGLLKVTSSQDPRFSYGTIEEGRKLANKLWNVARLFLSNAGEEEPDPRPHSVEERWILARIDGTRRLVEQALEEFNFAAATAALYRLTFDEFCDWYAESIKPRLYAGDSDARATALAALDELLKLLHPIMPHVTEEIWSHLPARKTRLIVASWSTSDRCDNQAVEVMNDARTAARIYRRSGLRSTLEGDSLRIFEAVVRPTSDGAGDIEAERARLGKEIERAERMLANEKFVANAAPEAVEAEREKLAQYRAELDALA
jgi:valyl-tRNA synthetase